MRIVVMLCLAVLLLWLCGPAWALLPAELDKQELRLSLGAAMGYLQDPDGNPLCLYHAGENRLNPPWRLQSDA